MASLAMGSNADAAVATAFLEHLEFRTATAFTLGALALLSLRQLSTITSFSRRWKEAVWSRVEAALRDPELSTGLENSKSDRSDITVPVPATRLLQPPPDPYRGVAVLDGLTFLWSLSFFGTTLLFRAGDTSGCRFIGACATLLLHWIRISAFAVSVIEMRNDGVGPGYDLHGLCGFLGVRFVFSLVATALQGYSLVRVAPVGASICEAETNRAIGATWESLDLVVALLLIGRSYLAAFMGTLGAGLPSGWRPWIRILLTRRIARLLAILLWVVSGFAGALGASDFPGTWITTALSLLVVLYAYNQPPVLAAQTLRSRNLDQITTASSPVTSRTYNESKLNARIAPPSSVQSAYTTEADQTRFAIRKGSDADRHDFARAMQQKPIPAVALQGLPHVPPALVKENGGSPNGSHFMQSMELPIYANGRGHQGNDSAQSFYSPNLPSTHTTTRSTGEPPSSPAHSPKGVVHTIAPAYGFRSHKFSAAVQRGASALGHTISDSLTRIKELERDPRFRGARDRPGRPKARELEELGGDAAPVTGKALDGPDSPPPAQAGPTEQPPLGSAAPALHVASPGTPASTTPAKPVFSPTSFSKRPRSSSIKQKGAPHLTIDMDLIKNYHA